mgnify:CR=1 FL=1
MTDAIESQKRQLSGLKQSLTKLLDKLSGQNIQANILPSMYEAANNKFQLIKTKQQELICIVEPSEHESMSDSIADYQIDVQSKLCNLKSRMEIPAVVIEPPNANPEINPVVAIQRIAIFILNLPNCNYLCLKIIPKIFLHTCNSSQLS